MSIKALDIRGRKVAYFDTGTGAPLLYLHGWADIHALTGELQPFHQALAARSRLLAPAHPGLNGTDDLPNSWSIDDVTFHMLEVMDAFQLSTCDVVGHSFGGWLAAELATRVPERIRSLTLIGAMGLFVEGAPTADIFMHAQPERGVDYRTLRNLLFTGPDAPLALEYYPNGRTDLDIEVRRYQMLRTGSYVGFKPPYFYNRQLADRLYRANMPATVIWGAEDHFVPIAHGTAFVEKLGNAKSGMTTIAAAGHSAPLEQPEATSAAVLAHLEENT